MGRLGGGFARLPFTFSLYFLLERERDAGAPGAFGVAGVD